MEQQELELTLLNRLHNDREKFDKYIGILSTCTKPYDVADKVIKPMFLEGSVSKDEIGTNVYYGTLAELVEHLNHHHIAPKSIYYHINAKLSSWIKKKNEQDATARNEAFRQETRIIPHTDGSLEIFNYIYLREMPADVTEMLKPYIEQGFAEMKKKLQRNFNARGESEVMELKCASWLMFDVLQALKEHTPEMTLDYRSCYTRQEHITLDEALEILASETDEEQEAF